MEKDPYSIFYEHRPLRIVFFVSPSTGLSWMDKIFEWNREKWGGRYNPIVITDGVTIDEQSWEFLRGYDPDIIIALLPLEEELLKKINTFLTPFYIENIAVEEDGYRRIYLTHDDPLSVLPTRENVDLIAREFGERSVGLVLFELTPETPAPIRNFLSRSFQILEDAQGTLIHVRRAIQENSPKIYRVTDYESLNVALLDMGDFQSRLVFPAQICSIPNSIGDAEYSNDQEHFAVVVGESLEDQVFFWNRGLRVRKWLRHEITQIIIPKELLENETIRPGLKTFLRRYTSRIGNSDHHGLEFLSFSETAEELSRMVAIFSQDTYYGGPLTATRLEDPQLPNFRDGIRFFGPPRGLQFHRAHSPEEHIRLDRPAVAPGVMGGQKWAVNLYIQYRPENFRNIHGITYWWQFPKRKNLLLNLGVFNKRARINAFHMPTILMQESHQFDPDQETLVVKLPEDRNIFHSLMCGPRFDQITDERRYNSGPYSNMGRSDKGMYLSGILSFFPDLLNTNHYLVDDKYWRKVFARMANRSIDRDPAKKAEVLNVIKKSVERGFDPQNPRSLEWLANRVFTLAKGISMDEKDFTFQEFLDERKKQEEVESAQELPQPQSTEDSEAVEVAEDNSSDEDLIRELQRDIDDLVEYGILLVGIKPRCPNCGYQIWYPLDEAEQIIKCKGCSNSFSISSRNNWVYKLNSLARTAVIHGVMPVLSTLNRLQHEARSSFIFTVNQELFKNEDLLTTGTAGPCRELDIVCIKDGELVLGETKQSVDLFVEKDFDDMAEVAEQVKPDLVIFSSYDNQPNALVIRKITELEQRLTPLEVRVEWRSLGEE